MDLSRLRLLNTLMDTIFGKDWFMILINNTDNDKIDEMSLDEPYNLSNQVISLVFNCKEPMAVMSQDAQLISQEYLMQEAGFSSHV